MAFSRWGADYVKMDFCRGDVPLPNGSLIDPAAAYADFSRALNKTGRPMYFLACYTAWVNKTTGLPRPGHRGPWEWAHPDTNAYRLGGDHHDSWVELEAELERNRDNSRHSIAGSFGDWDALVTGGQGCVTDPSTGRPVPPPPAAPCSGGLVNPKVDCGPPGGGPAGVRCPNMTDPEYRTAFSIWVIAASPLIIDADVRNMTAFQRATLLDAEMLAIHTDPLARGGTRIGCCHDAGKADEGGGGRRHGNSNSSTALPGCTVGQVWAKPLMGNETAVALVNAAAWPQHLEFSFGLLGYGAADTLQLRDVWGNRTDRAVGRFRSPTEVPSHGTLVLRVSR